MDNLKSYQPILLAQLIITNFSKCSVILVLILCSIMVILRAQALCDDPVLAAVQIQSRVNKMVVITCKDISCCHGLLKVTSQSKIVPLPLQLLSALAYRWGVTYLWVYLMAVWTSFSLLTSLAFIAVLLRRDAVLRISDCSPRTEGFLWQLPYTFQLLNRSMLIHVPGAWSWCGSSGLSPWQECCNQWGLLRLETSSWPPTLICLRGERSFPDLLTLYGRCFFWVLHYQSRALVCTGVMMVPVRPLLVDCLVFLFCCYFAGCYVTVLCVITFVLLPEAACWVPWPNAKHLCCLGRALMDGCLYSLFHLCTCCFTHSCPLFATTSTLFALIRRTVTFLLSE